MARNCAVHEGRVCGMKELSSRVGKVSWEHWTAWQHKLHAVNGQSVWKAQSIGKVKVNVDVAVRDQFDVIAALVRDYHGVVKGSTFVKIEAVQPLEGEAAAAKLGVEFAFQMGFKDIILEGDSELVIKAVHKWPIRTEWRIYSLISDIVELGNQLESMHAVHILRDANEAVHHLARWAASEFSSGRNPRSCEHFLELPWVYAGTDPP